MEEERPPDGATLRAFFGQTVTPAALDGRVRTFLASLGALGLSTASAPSIAPLTERDWAGAWREHFRPRAVGRRFLVAPPWDVPAVTDRIVLVIEPGRAFGTGQHGSTAGCLVLLERAVAHATFPGAIDLGTGSGILAIAAARLGVARILAIDDDPDAVAAAVGNAALNGVARHVECRRADAATLDVPAAPLVVANLLSAAHERLGARYRRLLAPGGTLVLGGILDVETDVLREGLERHGLVSGDRVSIDGWTALAFHAPLRDLA